MAQLWIESNEMRRFRVPLRFIWSLHLILLFVKYYIIHIPEALSDRLPLPEKLEMKEEEEREEEGPVECNIYF